MSPALKDGTAMKECTFYDEAGEYIYTETPTKDTPSRLTDVYFWIFENYN